MSERSLKDYLDELPKSIVEQIESVSSKMKLDEKQKERLIEEVVKEYFKSMYEPGEAIGIIAAQSISEPATQMSLPFEEKILVKEGDILYPIEIGKFVDGLMSKFGSTANGDYEILDIPEDVNFYVYSLDEDEKLRQKRIKAVIRHKSPEKLLQIKTSSGRRIVATDHHSFVVRRDNKIIPVSGRLLKAGDRIPVIKHLPEHCVSSISLESMMPSEGLAERVSQSNLELDYPLGLTIGEYLSKSNDKRFVFNNIHINPSLLSKLKAVCGDNLNNKRIPFFAFSAREDFVKGLLQAYFDHDTNIKISKKGIRAYFESRELLDGIALLLARFGIFCKKSKNGKSIWISSRYAQVFYEKIGLSMKERREMLRQLYGTHSKTDEMIPGIGNSLLEIARKLNYPARYVKSFTEKQIISKDKLEKYIVLFENMAKERNVDISTEISVLKKAINSDVVWDRIEEISFIDSPSEYVYDISVDGLETFTTFDGIVTHNTMRTYHFAASAGIQVTLGLPRLIEIFDARKEPTTPMMTIYLKPEYNTKEKAEEFAKKINEKRIKYYATELSADLTNKKIKIIFGKAKKADMEEIVARLEKFLKDFHVKSTQNTVVIEAKKDVSIKELERIKRKILSLYVSGVEGVKNSVVVKEGDNWVIKTLGSNLQKVLHMEEVDATKTYSNNIHEIANVLGIEAARNVLIKEINNTLKQQGLQVDERHITTVVDIMCFTGEVRPIGRYGVAGTQSAVLARAGFEETIKHLVRASVRNEVDEFEGIFDNVMINQQIPAGTGMFELISKMGEEE